MLPAGSIRTTVCSGCWTDSMARTISSALPRPTSAISCCWVSPQCSSSFRTSPAKASQSEQCWSAVTDAITPPSRQLLTSLHCVIVLAIACVSEEQTFFLLLLIDHQLRNQEGLQISELQKCSRGSTIRGLLSVKVYDYLKFLLNPGK